MSKNTYGSGRVYEVLEEMALTDAKLSRKMK